MRVSIEVDFARAHKLIARLSGPQVQQAAATALNDAAFEARKVIQQQMDSSFDRVTPYIRRSVYVDPATPQRPEAQVYPRYMGGKGVDPQNVLRAEVFGGARKTKASERAMQRIGALPQGYVMVPASGAPLDGYGNLEGSFLAMLVSYFQAFGEQGYRANMTAKRKAKMADKRSTAAGYSKTHGVRYFISHGKARGGRGAHLAAGIWSASGIHDSIVKPVIMFVRSPSYARRLDFFGKPVQAAGAKFNPRFRYQLRRIIEGKT